MTDPHPLVAGGAQALDRAGVRWCLLRGRDRLHAPTGDVDLLASRRQFAVVCHALVGAGFAVRRSWADRSQIMLVGFDAPSGSWVHLHVMTQTAFGDGHAIVLPAAEALLARRVRGVGLPEPAPEDAFWHLLLHCLLDKRRVTAAHANELLSLAAAAGAAPSPLARLVDRRLPARLRASVLHQLVAARAWAHLEDLGRQLHATWSRRPAARIRRAERAAVLAGHKVVEAATRPGMSVALLAPDGAGKSSVAAGMREALPLPARGLYLGLYGGLQRGARAHRMPGMATLGRGARAWGTYLTARYHQARRRIVIFDRYTYDARLPDATATARTRLRRALLARLLPAPDLVVVLDAPAAVLHARKPEHPLCRLEQQRAGYLRLATQLPRCVVVDADRPLDAVQRDVSRALWQAYAARRGRC